MPIKTSCPHCQTPYTLGDTMVGKEAKCKSCGETFTVKAKGATTLNKDKVQGKTLLNGDIKGKVTSRSNRTMISNKPTRDDDDDRPRRKTRLNDDDDRPRRKTRLDDDYDSPAKSRRRDDDEDDRPRRRRDDDDDYDDRPRRKQKSKTPLIIGLVVGGVLLIGGGVTAAILIFGGKGEDNTQAKNDEKNKDLGDLPDLSKLKFDDNGKTLKMLIDKYGEKKANELFRQAQDLAKKAGNQDAGNKNQQAGQKKPKDIIVGKWRGPEENDMIVVAEFAANGTLRMTGGPFSFSGAYVFLDDKSLQVNLDIGGKLRIDKYEIKSFSDDKIVTADEKGKIEELTRLTPQDTQRIKQLDEKRANAQKTNQDPVAVHLAMLKGDDNDKRRAAGYFRSVDPKKFAGKVDEVSAALETAYNSMPMDMAPALVVWATKKQVPTLLKILDTNDGQRRATMQALADFKETSAIDKIAPYIEKPINRRDAIDALQKFGDAARPALMARRFSKDFGIRAEIQGVLGKMGVKDDAVLPEALKGLASTETEVRRASADWLRSIAVVPKQQDTVAAALMKAAGDKDIRGLAFAALQKWATSNQVFPLVAMLEQEANPPREIFEVLGQIKDERTAAALVPLMSKKNLTFGITGALRNIGAPAQKPLLAVMNHEVREVRNEARNLLLATIKADRALLIQQSLADLKEPPRRQPALEFLESAQVEPTQRDAVKLAVEGFVGDSDIIVQNSAKRVMTRWAGAVVEPEPITKKGDPKEPKTGDPKKDLLVGKWQASLKGITLTVEFSADGKIKKSAGQYSILGQYKFLDSDHVENTFSLAGKTNKEKMKIDSLDKEKLVAIDDKGERVEFARMTGEDPGNKLALLVGKWQSANQAAPIVLEFAPTGQMKMSAGVAAQLGQYRFLDTDTFEVQFGIGKKVKKERFKIDSIDAEKLVLSNEAGAPSEFARVAAVAKGDPKDDKKGNKNNGDLTPENMKALIKSVTDKTSPNRHKAMSDLAKYKVPDAAVAIASRLTHGLTDRAHAIKCLREMGAPFGDACQNYLFDKERFVREASVHLIRDIGSANSAKALYLSLQQNGKDKKWVAEINQALAAVKGRPFMLPPSPFQQGGGDQPQPLPIVPPDRGKGPPFGRPGLPRQGAEIQPEVVVPERKEQGLAGTTWVGRENLKDFGRLEFQFLDKTRCVMVDARERRNGTYEITDDRVTLRFFDGDVVYEGNLVGDKMAGDARNDMLKLNWKWNVDKTGAQPVRPAPPRPVPLPKGKLPGRGLLLPQQGLPPQPSAAYASALDFQVSPWSRKRPDAV